jgi:hypothetical protein
VRGTAGAGGLSLDWPLLVAFAQLMAASCAVLVAPSSGVAFYRWLTTSVVAECVTTAVEGDFRSRFWRVRVKSIRDVGECSLICYPEQPGNRVTVFKEVSGHDGGLFYGIQKHEAGWLIIDVHRSVKRRLIEFKIGFESPDIPHVTANNYRVKTKLYLDTFSDKIAELGAIAVTHQRLFMLMLQFGFFTAVIVGVIIYAGFKHA